MHVCMYIADCAKHVFCFLDTGGMSLKKCQLTASNKKAQLDHSDSWSEDKSCVVYSDLKNTASAVVGGKVVVSNLAADLRVNKPQKRTTLNVIECIHIVMCKCDMFNYV